MNDKELPTKYPGDWNDPTSLVAFTDPLSGKELALMAQYGDWAVTDNGDVIQTREWNIIWSDTLLEDDGNDDWILHFSNFRWFTIESYEDFKRALWLACKIIGIPYPKQKREY